MSIRSKVERVIQNVRSTRDLRAEILALAMEMKLGQQGHLFVRTSGISQRAIAVEWARAMLVLVPTLRNRMSYVVRDKPPDNGRLLDNNQLALGRPNYCFEVLRLLIESHFSKQSDTSLGDLIHAIGASQTPIRGAVQSLRNNGILSPQRRGLRLQLAPQEISPELMARLGALPQRIKFRFRRGARIKSPLQLLARATPLLRQAAARHEWSDMALSGVPLAQKDVRQIDIAGVPRLDLVARVPRDIGLFHPASLQLLDDGLEVEENTLAPTPVVVTIVRADVILDRNVRGKRCAPRCDVFLALLDLGLRDQAIDYARRIRQ